MPISQLPTSLERQRFRRRLFTWYRKHGRDLPWRHTNNPYHILVSEVMLQQTQVERVLPKYHEWLTKYPSLAALADAPIKKVVFPNKILACPLALPDFELSSLLLSSSKF